MKKASKRGWLWLALGVTAFCLAAVSIAVFLIAPRLPAPDVADTATSDDSEMSATSETQNLPDVKVTHIAEIEKIPQISHEDTIRSAVIAGLVKADYIKAESVYDTVGDGVFCVHDRASYEVKAYFTVENGALVPLEVTHESYSFDYDGHTWSLNFDYAEIDGCLYVNSTGYDIPYHCTAETLYAGGDELLLKFYPSAANRFSMDVYTMLYNYKTHALTDFLAGCGIDGLDYYVNDIILTKDLRYAILECGDSEWYTHRYICDIGAKTLTPLNALPGIGENWGSCRVWFLDDRTVFYMGNPVAENSLYAAFRMDLDTGEWERLPDFYYYGSKGGLKFLHTRENCAGYYYDCARYAVMVEEDGRFCLVDFITDEQWEIEGFIFDNRTDAVINLEETKICFYGRSTAGRGYFTVAVLDIPSKSMAVLVRMGQAFAELNVAWCDENRFYIYGSNYTNDSPNYVAVYGFSFSLN